MKNVLDILETLTPERRSEMDAISERETDVAATIHDGARQMVDMLMQVEKLPSTGNRMNIFRKTAHNMMTDVIYMMARHDDNMTREQVKQLIRLYRDEVALWFDNIIDGAYDQVRDMIEQREANAMKQEGKVQ